MATAIERGTSIMLVDDAPANLVALEEILGERGYQVRSYTSGRVALDAAAKEPPDLFLLDINMPEMDGYEMCERLKADLVLASAPVIFISGLTEMRDKMRAFNAGGVDYVTKPFNVQEVCARVETHLTLRWLRRRLEIDNAQLEGMVRIRTHELEEANARLEEANARLRRLDEAKSHFLCLIAHELRAPLTGLFGAGETLIAACPPGPQTQKLASIFTRARDRMRKVTEDALLLTQMEVGKASYVAGPIPLSEVLEAALDRARKFADTRSVAIGPAPVVECMIPGDMRLCVRAVQALLETAVRFSQEGGTVWTSADEGGREVALRIEARGLAVPEAELPRFFEVLAIAGAVVPGADLGLDPPLAGQILSLFGGRAAVENLDPPGIRLTAHIPTCAAHASA